MPRSPPAIVTIAGKRYRLRVSCDDVTPPETGRGPTVRGIKFGIIVEPIETEPQKQETDNENEPS
jgi:hypothetical protein